MLKPSAVRYFDVLFWAGLGISLLAFILLLEGPRGGLFAQLNATSFLGYAVVMGGFIGMWFLISVRGRSWARIVFAIIAIAMFALQAVALAMQGFDLSLLVQRGGNLLSFILDALRFGLWSLGAVLLFTANARPWFTPSAVETDAEAEGAEL